MSKQVYVADIDSRLLADGTTEMQQYIADRTR